MQASLTAQSIFWPREKTFTKHIFLVLLATIILSLASQISIPLQPVPLTFQSVTVVLLGMALGARLGGAAVILYLLAGACGLPVFANFNAGLAVFTDPTAGYLMAFLPAVIVSGYLAQHGYAKSFFMSLSTALISTAIIFIGGISYLTHLVGFHKAIVFGLTPFIVSEPIKLIALSLIAPKFWK